LEFAGLEVVGLDGILVESVWGGRVSRGGGSGLAGSGALAGGEEQEKKQKMARHMAWHSGVGVLRKRDRGCGFFSEVR
jgi:hypothetical protein